VSTDVIVRVTVVEVAGRSVVLVNWAWLCRGRLAVLTITTELVFVVLTVNSTKGVLVLRSCTLLFTR
jgi:hypothetical protein